MASTIAASLTSALSTTLADFGTILSAVVPIVFGITVGVFLLRKARGLVH